MTFPLLSSLLFWQMLVLALVAGGGSVRVPEVGAALLALLLFVPKWRGGRAFLRRAALLLMAFGAGYAAMHLALAEVPDKPSWAAIPRRAVLVEGRVDSVTGLPGGRVRLLLERVKPVDRDRREVLLTDEIRKAMQARIPDGTDGGRKAYAGAVFKSEEAELPGLVAVTLDSRILENSTRPLTGQTVTALMRLYPSGGSRNVDEHAVNAYWAARQVWHNGRLVWREGRPLLLNIGHGEGLMFQAAALRETWRASMLSMFEAASSESEGNSPLEKEGVGPKPTERTKNIIFAREVEPPAYSQGYAIIAALLFGDRSLLTTHTVDLFTRAGLVHSLALSGQHLALAAMAGMLCIFLLARLRCATFFIIPKRIILAWTGIPFALAYLYLGGAPFSLVRAALMMLVAAFYISRRAPVVPLDALFAAVFLLFAGWPPAVFELSAQLSVLAVAGIMLALPPTKVFLHRFKARPSARWRTRTWKALMRWGGTMLIVSLAAQMAVLPVLALTFGAVSPCVWLNMLWLPPLTFITLPCAAFGLCGMVIFGPQALSEILFDVAAWPADVMIDLLEWLGAEGALPLIQCVRPEPLTILGYALLLIALAIMVERWRLGPTTTLKGGTIRRLLICGGFLMLAGQMPLWLDAIQARWQDRVTLTLLDVGQGQAALLEYPGGRVLIDGGGSSSPYFDCGRSIVAPALTRGKLPHLDAVIVSHTDVDHARGLRWILERFTVGALYWSPVSAARADSGEGRVLRDIAHRRAIPERILRRGDALELGRGLWFEVIAPDLRAMDEIPSKEKLSNNDASLAFRLVHNGQGLAILCGDIHSSALRRLTENTRTMQSEVLVLPHHGAASSFQKKWYDAVDPKVALASAASYNHYGFPNRRVRDEMARRGVPLFSTSDMGTVSVRWIRGVDGYELEHPDTGLALH